MKKNMLSSNMLRMWIILLTVFLYACSSDSSEPDPMVNPNPDATPNPMPDPDPPAEPVLIWSDEFDGTELNLADWNFELGDGCDLGICGWGNNEPQIYTALNHEVNDGMLTINILNDGGTYTSTRITTKDKVEFTYGRIEARAKLPVGTGVWPAIWMLGANIDDVGWPTCGEIDILEYVGKNPDEVFNSVHTLASSGNTVNTKTTAIADIEEGFHVFAANWTSNRIEFFVDDVLLYTYFPPTFSVEHWPFNEDFYLILNTAVGGNFGGPDIDDDIFPQEFVIDYIRVYSN